MATSTVESFATQAAIASLNLYRTHISPRKGFSCPHRLLHGDESCSAYVHRILANQSLSAAIQLAPQRFQACKAAAQTLATQKAQGGCIIIPCCLPI
ncbi:membrane protein insertion efficiency factor YidD [Leptolyngbya sp. AN02str]|uniref:membrane protein insertion efficiency factor YidD n=1 Tax=Leptolyngbya sp. AN02str TaxID=3423363 RepID=UPI003D31B49A